MKQVRKSYLTPNQVAELLMVSPATVRQWAEKGKLKALLTPGGHRRFLHGDVETFALQRGLTLNSRHSGALRVLIVDDDEQLRSYLTQLLSGYPGQVVVKTASNGFKAGILVSEFSPQVILLDLMMPGLNGFELCQDIKSSAASKDTRVIAMTGYPSDDNVKKILDAGAEVCLSKPFSADLIKEYLGLIEGDS